MAAIKIRPTEKNRIDVCMIFLGSSTVCPFARFSAVHCDTFRSRSNASALMKNREDSTFANVIRPRTMGSVSVGSECDREVRVRKDSESKTLGCCDNLEKTMEVPINKGS